MSYKITPGDVVRLEGVDVPLGASFHYLQNKNIKLRVMTAPAGRVNARGSIIFQPGRTEFIEKYFETADDFIKRGFAVIIIDPRGQGLSTRLLNDPMKSYVDDFEDYCDDLACVVQAFQNDLPRPHVLMGHSMGGTIGLQSVLTGRLNPAACVFTAPMLGFQDIDTSFMSKAVRFFSWVGFSHHNLPFQAQRNGQLFLFAPIN